MHKQGHSRASKGWLMELRFEHFEGGALSKGSGVTWHCSFLATPPFTRFDETICASMQIIFLYQVFE